MAPSVFIVGLGWKGSEDTPETKLVAGFDSLAKLAATVTASMEEVRNAGYEMQNVQIEHATVQEDLETIRTKLRENQFDLYIIGFGVRGVPKYTWIFEELVNAARELSPGTRMGFNTAPTDMLETVRRNGF